MYIGTTCPMLGFNPRLREGGDAITGYVTQLQARFNPRLREGGDNKYAAYTEIEISFNPRLREGGDW